MGYFYDVMVSRRFMIGEGYRDLFCAPPWFFLKRRRLRGSDVYVPMHAHVDLNL
jgi:hypothetical protein